MYKLSNYNYFVEDGNKVIYFNGMSGTVFAMSGKEHEKIISLFDNLPLFKENYPSVFERFLNWGFFVPEDTNEIANLKFKNKKAVFSDKFYRLIMNPTTDCVFNCWYCNQHSQDKGRMSEETMDKIRKHIDYMVNVDKITGLHLDWFGGEPLMYFNEVILPISEYGMEVASKNNIPFVNQITTNAYLINEVMVKKMKDIQLRIFQITIDGDEKRHNKIRNVKGAPSFQRIMQNINLILENIPEVHITLRLNYDDSTLMVSVLDKVFSLIPEKYRNRVFPNFQRVWQTVKEHPGNNENEDLVKLENTLERLGYKAIYTSEFCVGRVIKCYGDRLYNTVIDYDGKVYKCTANTQKECGILNDNGVITWYQDTLTRLYAKAPFENKKCLACKHLPICLSSCVQHFDGSDEAPVKCALDYAETSVENFIKSLLKTKVPVV
jgi:uncharacterized protein